MDQILRTAHDLQPGLVRMRRHLHSHPELSFNEKNTATFIAQELNAIGLEPREGVAGHGVVALIQGANEGPCVALRADMDALPVQEVEGRDHASTVKGVMHACGHDAHTSMLLGAARGLFDMRAQLHGTVKLIFQPAEERLPGGARLMIEEGVLKDPEVACIIGQHVTPEIPAGKVAFHAGPFMASADEIHLTVIGKGGHAAKPHQLIDPVLITSHLIIAMQQVVSRMTDPSTPTVLSFGKVIADGATNIIPDRVHVEGTLRTFDEAWREQLLMRLPVMMKDLISSMGGRMELDLKKGYPVLVNDPSLTERTRAAAIRLLGIEQVVDTRIRMGAEDFAFYSHQVPACFFRLGTGNEKKGITSGLHTPSFDIDEDALHIGSALMMASAFDQLSS